MGPFRLLKPDEIEIRRGRNFKNGNVELLCYKTARTDMNLLDEVYGVYGWAKDYKELNGVVYCGVAIYSKERNAWLWKWDCGSEGNFEKEKAQASDAFKRACFNLGLGRELYSAPRIVVTPESDYTTYFVQDIGYDDKDRISTLVIVDNKGKVVFNYVDGKTKPVQEINRADVLKAVCSEFKEAGENTEQLKKFFYYYQERCENFDTWNTNLVRKLWEKWKAKSERL